MPARPIVLTAAAILLAVTSMAYGRPDARTMTCDETRQLIHSRRAIVLTTGRNTYDRYVRQYGNECDWPEAPVTSYIRTLDRQCRVHRCEEPVLGLR
ncbi:hypothetical protein [Mesorhizobium onobrychidis]|uniref:KTSC domain-containing protein n=1 Tax=Mesorhizobium onobrychidis TaxID=2775404 RepID=A0ABY5R566_9HYPH|nr:hypothetical protein [Mesorhizobium onobrychidis]UVC18453.1 hypothetical protein IHQ72_16085 [Mesorhizobium onobrychidis]